MKTRVQRWGESLAVRIPDSMADEMALQENADVEIDPNDGVIVVHLSHAAKPSLEDLIAQITPENVHGEVDWGRSMGHAFLRQHEDQPSPSGSFPKL